jgi:histidinol phosphatase-like enzyme (inositol monophosphatase family)
MDEPLADLLEFATSLAWQAGRRTLAHFQTGVDVERKEDASPVTLADRDAETFLRDRIGRRFPDDGIVGEEFGVVAEGARRRWIIDPIDGTRTFVRGVPLYGVMIALEIDGEAQLGVINIPALNEIVSAATGLGCWWNSRRAHVSDVADLDGALVLTTDIENIEKHGQRDRWDRLRNRVGLTRTWGDCYGYVLVATGRAEAMIDGVLSIWDAAAVAPIIREAGGVVSDIDGIPGYRNGTLVATNTKLGGAIRQLLGTNA